MAADCSKEAAPRWIPASPESPPRPPCPPGTRAALAGHGPLPPGGGGAPPAAPISSFVIDPKVLASLPTWLRVWIGGTPSPRLGPVPQTDRCSQRVATTHRRSPASPTPRPHTGFLEIEVELGVSVCWLGIRGMLISKSTKVWGQVIVTSSGKGSEGNRGLARSTGRHPHSDGI